MESINMIEYSKWYGVTNEDATTSIFFNGSYNKNEWWNKLCEDNKWPTDQVCEF